MHRKPPSLCRTIAERGAYETPDRQAGVEQPCSRRFALLRSRACERHLEQAGDDARRGGDEEHPPQ
jgi:hypothetical protein